MIRLFVLFTLSLGILFPTIAEARIDIVPQKVIIDSRERSGEFTVLNLFNQKGNFRIELLNYSQNENGVYKKLKVPLDPAFDPKTNIRFSPRQFNLDAGSKQKVRLSVKRPAALPDGEYRFHVKATRFADSDHQENSDEPSIKVNMNMGIVIPVVIRHGKVISDAKMKDVILVGPEQTQKQRPELHLNLLREGNASAIGRLEVFWQKDGKKETQIGLISNANVFTEISQRKFKIPLKEMPVGKGKVIVRYSDEIKKGTVIDEVVLQR